MEAQISSTLLLEFLQGDTLALYLVIICLDYVLRTSIGLIKETGFTLKGAGSKRYPAETITDADYTDDLALLALIPTLAKFLPHSLEQAPGSIGLHVNANKREHMCFKREGAISTLSGGPLKLVDMFTYLSSNISSTECDVNICLAKE